MNEFENFVTLSKLIGERFDLIQSAGGNISYKIDDKLYIKSSGFALSDIDANNGFSILNYNLINEGLKNHYLDDKEICNNKMNEILLSSLQTNYNLPSMETYFHSFLDIITIHTHPISINLITTKENYEEVLNDLFPKSLVIKYCTPGLPLSIEIYKKYNKNINIIFLQNHGLIVTSNDYENAIILQENIINTIDKYLDINHYKYKISNFFSQSFNRYFNNNFICYLCDNFISLENDIIIKNYKPFLPDLLVFCGFEILFCNNIEELEIQYKEYFTKYKSSPSILYHKMYIYIFASTKRKAKDIEEVFRSYIFLANNQNGINYLNQNQLEEINSLNIETYRKNLK
jgi:ribulose-5-phosphate 4-epimerase/fuculose-1-phosphate aldolase